MPFAVVLLLALQTADAGGAPPATATTATAVRAIHPPAIDGRDDDAVWRAAPAITQFREFQPAQNGDPRFATEAKVAYDDRNLYVFIRAFDPHPDSILKQLARPDLRATPNWSAGGCTAPRRSGSPPNWASCPAWSACPRRVGPRSPRMSSPRTCLCRLAAALTALRRLRRVRAHAEPHPRRDRAPRLRS